MTDEQFKELSGKLDIMIALQAAGFGRIVSLMALDSLQKESERRLTKEEVKDRENEYMDKFMDSFGKYSQGVFERIKNKQEQDRDITR